MLSTLITCEPVNLINDMYILLGYNRNLTNDMYIFTPQPLRAVKVLFSPMVSGWAGGWHEKFVRALSRKPQGVGS